MAHDLFAIFAGDGRYMLSDLWVPYSIQGKVSGVMTRPNVNAPFFSADVPQAHASRPVAIRSGSPAAIGFFTTYSIIAAAPVGSGSLTQSFDYFLIGYDPPTLSPEGLWIMDRTGSPVFDASSLPANMVAAGWGTTNKTILGSGVPQIITTPAPAGTYAVWNTSPVQYIDFSGGGWHKLVLGAQATASGDVATLGVRRATSVSANANINTAENHSVSMILFDVAGL